MKVLSSILGAVISVVLSAMLCEPLYDLIWPGATDKREGGVGFFFVFMLVPVALILGALGGAILYRRYTKLR